MLISKNQGHNAYIADLLYFVKFTQNVFIL